MYIHYVEHWTKSSAESSWLTSLVRGVKKCAWAISSQSSLARRFLPPHECLVSNMADLWVAGAVYENSADKAGVHGPFSIILSSSGVQAFDFGVAGSPSYPNGNFLLLL